MIYAYSYIFHNKLRTFYFFRPIFLTQTQKILLFLHTNLIFSRFQPLYGTPKYLILPYHTLSYLFIYQRHTANNRQYLRIRKDRKYFWIMQIFLHLGNTPTGICVTADDLRATPIHLLRHVILATVVLLTPRRSHHGETTAQNISNNTFTKGIFLWHELARDRRGCA